MISTITWNVKWINNPRVVERLKILRKMNQFSIITIFKHYSNSVNVKNFKVILVMKNLVSNCSGNGKNCLFCYNYVDYIIVDENKEHATCEVRTDELQTKFTITFVYAKCNDHLGRPL